ncbi:hypothetical protein KR76_00053 [Pimelobacter simplex]|uniref:Uncharacterized protein n=1 Tax=Nocardioides simplex TaxID=2045 RepID=A0A0C5XBL3_NOCSI|nr:hypothetical protein KR76_00053 [Pimelobacter simplex]SFN00690.1 hypothetical protein SAMN05421671_4565 [Pimelobacter simplex]
MLPVAPDHSRDSTVVVTYGACSEVCLMPVRDLSVPVG